MAYQILYCCGFYGRPSILQTKLMTVAVKTCIQKLLLCVKIATSLCMQVSNVDAHFHDCGPYHKQR